MAEWFLRSQHLLIDAFQQDVQEQSQLDTHALFPHPADIQHLLGNPCMVRTR